MPPLNMTARDDSGLDSQAGRASSARSSLACESCKRRKAKCDRRLPSCVLCQKTSENCVYPTQRLKPGPKIGSSRRKHQRLRVDGIESKPSASQSLDDVALDKRAVMQHQASSGIDPHDGCTTTSHWRPPSQVADRRISNPEGLLLAPLSPSEPDEAESVEMPGSSPTDAVAANFIKAISLSSLIHPSHESRLTPPRSQADVSPASFSASPEGTQSLTTQACRSISISSEYYYELTDIYFDNMTSFSLFHQPSFGTKLQGVGNVLHLKALFASMFAFSARFGTSSNNQRQSSPAVSCDVEEYERFLKLATNAIDESLEECEDDTPPLALLQAMVLTTYHQLIRGVRGRAWRLLGQCVRIAYEQKLHLIDYEAHSDAPAQVDIIRWSVNEEKRRCWWALWEMDVFASTIRRSPMAIDWSMNQTYLPVDDALWFSNQYQASCFLEKDLMDRWRRLKESRNESPMAWSIVLNSLMREAQVLVRGNVSGILSDTDRNDHVSALLQYFHNAFCKKHSSEDAKQQAILESLRCTISALPEHLAYRGECLDFATNGRAVVSATSAGSTSKHVRQLHAAKYSIYLTIQLARFMVYHHFSFDEVLSGKILTDTPRGLGLGWTAAASLDPSDCKGLSNCVEVAEDVLAIVKNSVHCHVQWVNPFLASIVWIATAMQILRKVFESGSDVNLTESKCEVLRLTCEKYSQFWGTPIALMDNLDALEGRLREQRMGSVAAVGSRNRMMRECKDRRNSQSRLHGQTDDASAFDCTATSRPVFRQQASILGMHELTQSLGSSTEVGHRLVATDPIQEVDWMNTTLHPEALINWSTGSFPECDNPEVQGDRTTAIDALDTSGLYDPNTTFSDPLTWFPNQSGNFIFP
ncbi:fungal-specific transcription factor domain-containing protein [Dactylonectria estremocensis]|uniref:Fungal-specific transcription factor domain-containing protein n=1 Tax=Dactylonectria estremocensis TaxID=1079267 RepID=A0A9P9IP10_9HYPO|nr:fungal-specific transcription factor domain-containing protein [Dactylonectria estremocensis]